MFALAIQQHGGATHMHQLTGVAGHFPLSLTTSQTVGLFGPAEVTPCCAQELLAVQTAASTGNHTLIGMAATSGTSLSIAFSPAY